MYCIGLFIISHFTGLPLCMDTEDTTMSPTVTDITYSIVTGDTKTVRVDSLNMISAAEIHSSIPVLTVISLTLQLWNRFIMFDVILALIITLLKSPLLSFIFIWSRTDWFFKLKVLKYGKIDMF